MNGSGRASALLEPNHGSLLGGNPRNFGFSLDEILLTSGGRISVARGGVTAVVGGNNVGKSTLLREIMSLISANPHSPSAPNKVVHDLTASRSGDVTDLIAWLSEHASIAGDAINPTFVRHQAGPVHVSEIVSFWNHQADRFGSLGSFLAFYANAQQRFAVTGSVEMRAQLSDPPVHPIHTLENEPDRLKDVSGITENLFGTPLTLDRLARMMHLRVGKLDMPAPPIDAVTPEYREAMERLPTLDDQGDGIRGFMGILLPLVTGSYPLVVIDEPEAYLHPPQAHALGRLLGDLAMSGQIQVIVATHDQDFLAGLLSSKAPVSVVRVNRDGQDVNAHQLNQRDLRDVWNDPTLRYTNVLEGLFHRLAVLAEGEGDCSYLWAAADFAYQNGLSGIPPNEVLFVPTGGKDRMPKIAKILAAAQVPQVAAPDLDILQDREKVKSLVLALGGDWDQALDDLYARATQPVRGSVGPARVEHVLNAIQAVLEPRRNDPYTAELRAEVSANLRVEGPWKKVKKHGLSEFGGAAGPAIRELLAALRHRRVVPVEQGELEQLAPEVPYKKGQSWLVEALDGRHYENAETQRHIQLILAANLPKDPGKSAPADKD